MAQKKRNKRDKKVVEFKLRYSEPAARPPPTKAPPQGSAPQPAPQPPQPAPQVIPAHDPQLDQKLAESQQAVGSLKEELESVKAALESKDTFIAQQLAGITENLEGIQVISELVSTRYNPFLDQKEGLVFDGKDRTPMQLLRDLGALGTDGLAALAATRGQPVSELIHGSGNGHVAAGGGASGNGHAQPDHGHTGIADLPESSGRPPFRPDLPPVTDESGFWGGTQDDHRKRPAPFSVSENDMKDADTPDIDSHNWLDRVMREFEEPEPKTHIEAAMPAAARMTTRKMQRAVGGPRETFVALQWLEEMARRFEPALIYPCLDHYHQMDWIDPEVYDWLTGLAEGMVERDHGATWKSFDVPPAKLLELHQANLLFLSDLFSEKLRPEERRVLGQTVRTYFEGI